MVQQDVSLSATDGHALVGRLFEPAVGTAQGTVLVNPGLGLQARFYERLAAELAEAHGLRVLLYDYRGVGRSAPAASCTLLDWARRDYAGVLRGALQRWPDVPVSVIGHSTGGMFVGLVPESRSLSRLIFVATQHGGLARWPGRQRLLMGAVCWTVVPVWTSVFSTVPGRVSGVGADLPSPLWRAWARWMRHPEYLWGFPDEIGAHCFDEITAPILWYSMDDDTFFAPRNTVEAMVRRFPAAAVQRRHLVPAELGVSALGHSGPFRRSCREAIWPEMGAFLTSLP